MLGRTRLPGKCLKVITQRRSGIDDDDTARAETIAFLVVKIKQWNHNPMGACVRIPSANLAEWLTEMRKKPVGVSHVVREINQIGIKYLKAYRRTWDRGMIWTGPDASDEAQKEPVDLISREGANWFDRKDV